MPEPLGILVDPKGPAESLYEHEYKKLRTILQIDRATDERGKNFDELIGNLIFFFRGDHDMHSQSEILHKLIAFFLQDIENEGDGPGDGLLAGPKNDHFFNLDIEEHWTLVHTLTAIRRGGWFAKWLMIQVACIAKAERPEEKCPSPLMLAGSLTEAIDEWNTEEAQARAFAERRPDLLFPAPPAEPEAVPEPDATSKPAKAPRTRKARRKAA